MYRRYTYCEALYTGKSVCYRQNMLPTYMQHSAHVEATWNSLLVRRRCQYHDKRCAVHLAAVSYILRRVQDIWQLLAIRPWGQRPSTRTGVIPAPPTLYWKAFLLHIERTTRIKR
jgi:hypothetical protein